MIRKMFGALWLAALVMVIFGFTAEHNGWLPQDTAFWIVTDGFLLGFMAGLVLAVTCFMREGE